MSLIILDRDGVINQDSDAYIKSVDEWIPIPGSIDAIVALQQKGFTVAIATNQSGIGRGYYSLATLHAMHDKMNALITAAGGTALTCITFCPHTPEDNCNCRKPLPGLLDQVAEQTGLPLAGCYMVGDSARDLEAGLARDMQPILVLTGKGEKTQAKLNDPTLPCFENLQAFVNSL